MRRALIFALAAAGLNFILGFGGMAALGHAGFIGVGAYALVALVNAGVDSAWILWPAAVALAAGVAALIGLVFALFGVGLTAITGNGVFDAIGTVLIAVLLIAVALVLGVETKSLLVGEGASSGDVARIKQAVLDGPEVDSIIHLKTLYLGPEELMVGVKVAVDGDRRLGDVAAGIDTVEQRVPGEHVPLAVGVVGYQVGRV